MLYLSNKAIHAKPMQCQIKWREVLAVISIQIQSEMVTANASALDLIRTILFVFFTPRAHDMKGALENHDIVSRGLLESVLKTCS